MKQINSTRPKAIRQPRSKWRGDLKECSGNGSCGKFLSVDNFTKKGENKSGSIIYRAQCKLCWNVWRREDAKTEKGREKRRKHQKAYYENNPEKLEAKRLISEAKQKERLKKKCLRIIEKMLKKRLSQVKNNSRIDGIRVKVKSFGYDILSEFNSSNDYVLVRCDRGHERRAQLSNIISGRGGCNECKIHEGQERLVKSADKLGGKIITKFKSKRKKVLYECYNGHKTLRYPQSIWNGHHCGMCENGTNNYSFYHEDKERMNREGYFYQFNFRKDGRSYKMIGIATVWKARLRQYRSSGVNPFDISLTKMSMFDAFICEQEILHRKELQDIKMTSGLGFAGSTECFDVTDVNLFHPVHSV